MLSEVFNIIVLRLCNALTFVCKAEVRKVHEVRCTQRN